MSSFNESAGGQLLLPIKERNDKKEKIPPAVAFVKLVSFSPVK